MGVIDNGTIKGVIPEKTLFAVNYPGYPTSTMRAVETLGGEAAISKARLSETNYLELRFRPEDPFSHPVFGELHGISGLLLQLSRVQDKEKTGQEVKAEVVAKVDQCYKFKGMADYQYVAPVHVKLENGRKRQRLQGLQSEQGGPLDMEHEEMMILPPPLFSVKDIPEDLVLQPSEMSRASQRKALLSQQPWEMDIVPCFNLDFKIKEIPPKINWEDRLDKNSNDWHTQTSLAKLFEERPIWAKPTINDWLIKKGICLTDVQLRRYLFRLSYYFAYGPFRKLWIRNGYDPRKDPESRMFQMVDFRVPKPVRKAAQAYLIEKGEAAACITWSDICSFKEAPVKKFSYLQLYDLDDEYIQSQIRRPPEQSTCSEYTGWFSRSTIVRMRHHIRVRYLSLIPGDEARDLEQFESRKLGVLKRHDLIARSQSNRGVRDEGNNDKEQEAGLSAADLVDTIQHGSDLYTVNFDDEEEEEEEDDEDEDDYQPLEELSFGNNSRSTDSYMDSFDNIPKSYLQELLEKFPMNTGDNGGTVRRVDLSDEEAEYAIYEQDDDEED